MIIRKFFRSLCNQRLSASAWPFTYSVAWPIRYLFVASMTSQDSCNILVSCRGPVASAARQPSICTRRVSGQGHDFDPLPILLSTVGIAIETFPETDRKCRPAVMNERREFELSERFQFGLWQIVCLRRVSRWRARLIELQGFLGNVLNLSVFCYRKMKVLVDTKWL